MEEVDFCRLPLMVIIMRRQRPRRRLPIRNHQIPTAVNTHSPQMHTPIQGCYQSISYILESTPLPASTFHFSRLLPCATITRQLSGIPPGGTPQDEGLSRATLCARTGSPNADSYPLRIVNPPEENGALGQHVKPVLGYLAVVCTRKYLTNLRLHVEDGDGYVVT